MHFACKKFGQALIAIIAQTYEKVNKKGWENQLFPPFYATL